MKVWEFICYILFISSTVTLSIILNHKQDTINRLQIENRQLQMGIEQKKDEQYPVCNIDI